ncbi:MAG: MFS transporter [Acidobacteriota bacterium]|nr:MFS transporter [Acidobacteriota bacterium]
MWPPIWTAGGLLVVAALFRSSQNTGQTTFSLLARGPLGAGAGAVGALGTVAGASTVLAAVVLAARLTTRAAMAAAAVGSLLLVAGLLLAGSAGSLVQLYVGVALIGLSGGLTPPSLATAIGAAPGEGRERLLALYATVLSASLAGGPLLETAILDLAHQNVRMPFFLFATLPLVAVGLGMRPGRRPEPAPTAPSSPAPAGPVTAGGPAAEGGRVAAGGPVDVEGPVDAEGPVAAGAGPVTAGGPAGGAQPPEAAWPGISSPEARRAMTWALDADDGAALVAGLSAPTSQARPPAGAPPEVPPQPRSARRRHPSPGPAVLIGTPGGRVALIIQLLYSVPFATVTVFGALLARSEFGLDPAHSQLGFTSFFVMSFASRVVLVRRSPIASKLAVFAGCIVLTATGLALLASGGPTAAFFIAMALLGLPHGAIFPLALSLVASSAQPEQLAAANAGLFAVTSLAAAVTPAVLGVMASAFGYRAMAASALVPVAVFSILLATQRRGVVG